MRKGRLPRWLAALVAAVVVTLGIAVPAPAQATGSGSTSGGNTAANCATQTVQLSLTGYVNPVNGTDKVPVVTEICDQGSAITSPIVVVTWHGAARNASLMNPPAPIDRNKYNLTEAYTRLGLTVVNVNRIGTHTIPEDQLPPALLVDDKSEARAYAQLIAMLRAGTYKPGVHAFSKVAIVGHSFGGAIASEYAAVHDVAANLQLPGSPDTRVDAVVMIGYRHPAPNPLGVAVLLGAVQPATPPGYLASVPDVAETLEFYPPGTEAGVIAAARNLGDTATAGQLAAFGPSFAPRLTVTEDILNVEGDKDRIMCSVPPDFVAPGLECTTANLLVTERLAYPNAASIWGMVVPDAAHLSMLHNNANNPLKPGSFPWQVAWIYAHV